MPAGYTRNVEGVEGVMLFFAVFFVSMVVAIAMLCVAAPLMWVMTVILDKFGAVAGVAFFVVFMSALVAFLATEFPNWGEIEVVDLANRILAAIK